MQAIQTKYLPATNHKCSRIKAWCERGSITISYPQDARNEEMAHRTAANTLIARFANEDKEKYGTPLNLNPWSRQFFTGGLTDGSYAHVYID